MPEDFSIIISLKLFAKKKKNISKFWNKPKTGCRTTTVFSEQNKKGKIYFKLNLEEVTTMSVMAHLFIYYIETKFIKFTI